MKRTGFFDTYRLVTFCILFVLGARLCPGQVMDQSNPPTWAGGASNSTWENKISQTFVPALPCLLAAEAGLGTGQSGGSVCNQGLLDQCRVPQPFACLWRRLGAKILMGYRGTTLLEGNLCRPSTPSSAKGPRSPGAPSFRPPLAKGWEQDTGRICRTLGCLVPQVRPSVGLTWGQRSGGDRIGVDGQRS